VEEKLPRVTGLRAFADGGGELVSAALSLARALELASLRWPRFADSVEV